MKTHFSFLLIFIIFIINLWSFQRWSVGCTLLQNIWNWTWFIIIDVWCDGKSEIHLPTLVRQLLCLEPTDNLTKDHCFNLQSLPHTHHSIAIGKKGKWAQYEYLKKKVLIKHSVASNVPLSLFYDFKQSLNLEYEKQILRGHDMIIGCMDRVHCTV